MRGPLVPYTSLRWNARQMASRSRPLEWAAARPPLRKKEAPRSVSKTEKMAASGAGSKGRDSASGSSSGICPSGVSTKFPKRDSVNSVRATSL